MPVVSKSTSTPVYDALVVSNMNSARNPSPHPTSKTLDAPNDAVKSLRLCLNLETNSLLIGLRVENLG